MSYVPTVVYTPPPDPPSPRVRELDRELRDVIARYRREHPAVSDREVLQALGLTRRSLRDARSSRTVALAAMGLLGVVVGLVVFFAVSGGAGVDGPQPMIGVAVVALAAAVALALIKANR